MTFEERLAAIGVETRDFVPGEENCKRLYDKFYAEAKRICEKMSIELDGPFMVSLLLAAVAKRDIIIDRMETRIVNLTGERDYLAEGYGDVTSDCRACSYYGEDGDCHNEQTYCSFDFACVPENWRVDDA